MDALFTTDALLSLLTLTSMEIVLGIDNIIFIAILVAKLPERRQGKARRLGIAAALVTRLMLLFSISWITGMTRPLFSFAGHEITGRGLILLAGGMFLIYKATHEIHEKLEGDSDLASDGGDAPVRATFGGVILQIAILDIVFSLDSVITAVGMAQHLEIMVVAMVIAVGVMLVSASRISTFVAKHPTIKILALSFLILIGVTLVIEGWGGHVEKGYIYFAMFFSFAVELVNMRYRTKRKAIELREPRHKIRD